MKCVTALSLLVLASGLGAQGSVLEMRLVASPDYSAESVEFDLAKEQLRLRAWLDARGNRARVDGDPQAIREFNEAKPGQGGALSPHLHWYPRVIRAVPEEPLRWSGARFSFAVPLFTEEEYRTAPMDTDATLVELLPINMHATHFTDRDLDLGKFRAIQDAEVGAPAIEYRIAAKRREAYADWTEQNIGNSCAILVDGEVVNATVFATRIVGTGIITGAFSMAEATELARRLRGEAASAAPTTTVVKGAEEGPIPAGADPADIRAMQGAEAMLVAEARLREMIESGELGGVDQIVTFEEISAWLYEDGLLGMPEPIEQLDGSQVLMTGFMLPIDEVENIREFLLVQSLWSCCYGQPPDINGIVRVVMKGDARIDYQFDPIKVVGKFEVSATTEDGYCVDIYQLYADSVEIIR